MTRTDPPRVLVVAQPSLCLRAPDPQAPFLLAPGPGEGLDSSCRLACHLARAGLGTRLLGRLGDDDPGRHVARSLRDAGVEMEWLDLDRRHGPTNLWLRHLESSHYPGAGATLDETDLAPAFLQEMLQGVTHLHFNADTLFDAPLRRACQRLREVTRRRGISFSLCLDMRGSAKWPRYEAQGFLRGLLEGGSLLILPERHLGGLFPSFWTAEALLEGGHDLQGGEVFLLREDCSLFTSTPSGTRTWPPPEGAEPSTPLACEEHLARVLELRVRGLALEEAVDRALGTSPPGALSEAGGPSSTESDASG